MVLPTICQEKERVWEYKHILLVRIGSMQIWFRKVLCKDVRGYQACVTSIYSNNDKMSVVLSNDCGKDVTNRANDRDKFA